MIGYLGRVSFEDADSGTFGSTTATEDRIAASGLNCGDDGGRGGGAEDGNQLGGKVGGDGFDALESEVLERALRINE